MDERVWADTQYQDELIRAYVPDAEELELPHYELVAVAIERDHQAAAALAADATALNLDAAVEVIREPEMAPINLRLEQLIKEFGF